MNTGAVLPGISCSTARTSTILLPCLWHGRNHSLLWILCRLTIIWWSRTETGTRNQGHSYTRLTRLTILHSNLFCSTRRSKLPLRANTTKPSPSHYVSSYVGLAPITGRRRSARESVCPTNTQDCANPCHVKLSRTPVRLPHFGMSGPYDHGMNMPMHNMMDPRYTVYSGNFNAGYPHGRLAGPPTHFDGVAFWYNPNSTDQLYDRESNLFGGRAGGQQATNMESASVKHRRTRSGCFTCRSRRVKVTRTR